MSRLLKMFRITLVLIMSLYLCGTFNGCGLLAEKDHIKIARIGDKYITREDLRKYLRSLPDDERPTIVNKGDLEETLETYLNNQILNKIASKLSAENKISVDRGTARAVYLERNPEFKAVYLMQDGKAAGLTDLEYAALKDELELRVDRIEDEMLRNMALQFRINEEIDAKRLELKPEELEEEYEIRKSELTKPEWIDFIALRFPADLPNTDKLTGEIRRRIDEGTDFDRIVNAYHAKSPNLVFKSELYNNPADQNFRNFWANVTGCKKGQVFGPLFIPPHNLNKPDGSGTFQMPGSYMILKILNCKPQSQLELSEAEPIIAPPIFVRHIMPRFWKEYDAEMFSDKLPDPTLYR